MTTRIVVRSRTQPGSVADASVASELLGLASEDHQHAFDEAYELVDGVDYHWGLSNEYIPQTGTALPTSRIVVTKLGNFCFFEGWMKSVSISGGHGPYILRVPQGFRPSLEFLPKYFQMYYRRTGASGEQLGAVRMTTDYYLEWYVASLGTGSVTDIGIFRVKYLMK